VVAVLLGKLVVLTPVKVQQQADDIELEIALRLDLQNLGGVFLQQNQDALLFQVTPKRVASRDGEARLSDFARAVEVKDYGVG
jgi:hypothetical protein